MFGVPEAYDAPDVALAAYAYAAQIYCDFSGYTDIAIGVALLMGFVFPQNFNSPYRATSFRDFWRRWHMTLSRFLRDFLYIPLGGNRGGKWKTARNLMITMVLGGLWHGAAWGFVLWGGAARRRPGRGARPARARRRARPGCAGRSSSTSSCSAGSCSAPRPSTWPGRSCQRLAEPGAGHALDVPVALAVVVGVIGFQLLPPGPLERLRLRVAAPARLCARLRARGGGRHGRRYGAEPGRAALHLLPVLMPERRPSRPAAAARAAPALPRRARGGRSSPWCCSCCSRASSVRTAGEEMQPGLERDVVLGGRQARRLGRRPAAVRRVGRRRARLPGGRGRRRRGRLRLDPERRVARGPARVAGLVRPGRARRPSPSRRARSTRCS